MIDDEERKRFAGIQSGVDTVLHKLDSQEKKLQKIDDGLADVHAEVLHHGVRLRKLERMTEEHAERITFLERVPRARVTSAIPPLASLGEESPSGTWTISKENVQKWQKERENQLAAERWRALWSGGGKVAVIVIATVIIAGLGLLGGALLQQAAQHPPTMSAPVH
jgi:hypothetical protein